MDGSAPRHGARLHPRNQGFVWRNARHDGARWLTPEQLGAFDGFFRLEGLFSAEEIAAGGSVRKAYILEYAPDGAVTHKPDGTVATQDDPARQFPILQGGV